MIATALFVAIPRGLITVYPNSHHQILESMISPAETVNIALSLLTNTMATTMMGIKFWYGFISLVG